MMYKKNEKQVVTWYSDHPIVINVVGSAGKTVHGLRIFNTQQCFRCSIRNTAI